MATVADNELILRLHGTGLSARAVRELYDILKEVVDAGQFVDGLTATKAEINRAADASTRIVDATAATLTVTEADHDNKVITLNRAAGIAVTLPAATGAGGIYRFVVGTTVTSNTTTIKVVGDDIMTGLAIVAQDGGDTSVLFETAADSDTITLNGSTTGGIKGGYVELIDIAADTWFVRVTQSATGTEATPFSATVS